MSSLLPCHSQHRAVVIEFTGPVLSIIFRTGGYSVLKAKIQDKYSKCQFEDIKSAKNIANHTIMCLLGYFVGWQ